jgi:hypothetical protein
MFRWLASVSPIVIVLVSVLPSLAIGWGAREAKLAMWDRPAIIREATATADAACAIRTMDAANRAEQAERARQSRANAEALRIYREALDASERAATETQTRIEQEIAAYEHELVAEGRSCPVTQRDLDWVRGVGP